MDVASSVISIAHVAKKIYDIGNAAYKSKEEKEAFNDTIKILMVQVDSLESLAQQAQKNKDDPRFAGLRTLLESSNQFQGARNVALDSAGLSPGVLQRLQGDMDLTAAKLEAKRGFRANAKKLLWIHEKHDFEKIIAEIKQWTNIVDSVLSHDHHRTAIETYDDVKEIKKIQEIETAKAAEFRKVEAEARAQNAVREEKKAADKALRLQEAQRLEIVKWLSPLRFRERQSAILNQAPAGITKPDLVDREEFDIWLRGQPWILHCEGKPGAGKVG